MASLPKREKVKHEKSETEIETLNNALIEKDIELTVAKEIISEKDREIDTLNGIIAKKNREIVDINMQMKNAETRADVLLRRIGQSHVHRDWERMSDSSIIPFPSGGDIKNIFVEETLDFESIVCEVLDVITDKTDIESSEERESLFVNDIMSNMYNRVLDFVNNFLEEQLEKLQENFGFDPKDVKQFVWGFVSQRICLKFFSRESEMRKELYDTCHINGVEIIDEITSLINDEVTEKLTEDNLNLKKLAFLFLKVHFYGICSDEEIKLHPRPGTYIQYIREKSLEILSPGTKKYGQIKEGQSVQVVLPGIYFVVNGNSVCVVPPLVRRDKTGIV